MDLSKALIACLIIYIVGAMYIIQGCCILHEDKRLGICLIASGLVMFCYTIPLAWSISLVKYDSVD